MMPDTAAAHAPPAATAFARPSAFPRAGSHVRSTLSKHTPTHIPENSPGSERQRNTHPYLGPRPKKQLNDDATVGVVLRCFRAFFVCCFRAMFSGAPRAAAKFEGRLQKSIVAESRYVLKCFQLSVQSLLDAHIPTLRAARLFVNKPVPNTYQRTPNLNSANYARD